MQSPGKTSHKALELWAGFECTLNRVGDVYRDQLRTPDRRARVEVLQQLGTLGVSAFRYRIAWDDIEADEADQISDLALLREQSVEPIIGLIHHGSGPAHTDLLSDDFAPGLALHARRTAERFPWVNDWTPVNEPLTTARFSALYGHWFPHHRSERACWLALLNQIDATRLAMREIRVINPNARLIQTEDLGRTFATAALEDQAAFDNERRWLTWDLLCGRVVSGHPFYDRLCGFGFAERLRVIAADPCRPAVIGIDHYLTSDRFLDHRTSRYPESARGGNGRQDFADIEAVRVLGHRRDSIFEALDEAWRRYRIPVAMTECHNGCTREEQMRWLYAGWRAAERLNREGGQAIAVAAWALLGASDWTTLATDGGGYESGAFDPRGGHARPTGVARTMRALANRDEPDPVCFGPGWWQRQSRFRYRPAAFATNASGRRVEKSVNSRPLLIAGASGTLGQAIAAGARARGLTSIVTGRAQMALGDYRSVKAALDSHQPWAVINATGWVRVDEAEASAGACYAANTGGAIGLAEACARRGIPSVTFSSDLVFDGNNDCPYVETDALSPLSVYGRSKAEADEALLGIDGALVIRTAAFFSPHDRFNFAVAARECIASREAFRATPDHLVTPTYVPHLANAVLDLLIDRETGLWHLSSGVELSWYDFAKEVAKACALDDALVEKADPKQLGWIAARPRRAGLETARGRIMPPLEQALREFACA